MTKLLLAWLVFVPVTIFAASSTPASRTGIEEGVEFRLIKQISRFVLVTEMKARTELTDETYSQLLFGGYYRWTKRLRFGLFAQAEQGLRWDDDWRKSGAKWQWQKSDARWDYSNVFDTTFMDQISPKMAYELKTRFLYYHSRSALQLRVKPAIRYFILKEGKPLWQFYTAIEAYAPVNYGEGPLYELWLYTGVLYQLNNHLSLGPMLALRRRWFRSYDDFEDKSGKTFDQPFTSTNVGLTAVYSW